MTFENEEVRGRFHSLPTQKQFEWCEVELYLSRTGKQIHIEDVILAEDRFDVIIRIKDRLH